MQMNMNTRYIGLLLAPMLILGCQKDKWPAQPDWSQFPNPENQELMKPAECDNRIVAHRFGATECGLPENSVAALKYAMSQKLYGAECDAYVTKDNEVIIAHANGICEINGNVPYKTSLDAIRAAGKLSNGEQIPTLEELIDIVMKEDNPTRLVVDIKRISYPTNNPEPVIACAKRACEIVKEKKADNFVILLCTGFDVNVMKSAWAYASQSGITMAMNSGKDPAEINQLGFNWVNLAAKDIGGDASGSGNLSVSSYLNAGINVSVYNVDKQAGDGNAVYSSKAVKWYQDNYMMFKYICSNYPAWLKDVMAGGTLTYDGISSQEEFDLFAQSLAADPTGALFADADGVVNLKTDVTVTSACPLKDFKGTFDGKSHTVTINYEGDEPAIGLFGTLSGTVRNLNVAGAVTSSCKSESFTFGGIAVNADAASFENCTSSIKFSAKSDIAATPSVCIGGIAGVSSGNVSFISCRSTGSISYEGSSAVIAGGILSSNQADDGKVRFSGCEVSCGIDFGGSCTSAWNYAGGFIGKPVSSAVTSSEGTDYRLEFSGCSYTGDFKVAGAGKIRAGMLAGFANASFLFQDCSASGSLVNENTSKRDFVAAAMIGFIEKNVEGRLNGCTFSGKVESCTGSNNYIGGIIGNTADNSIVVCDNCRTTASASAGSGAIKSVGMIAARLKTAGCTIQNCRIAGKINKAGTVTTISAENLEDWMIAGSGTAIANVTLSGNGFNNE